MTPKYTADSNHCHWTTLRHVDRAELPRRGPAELSFRRASELISDARSGRAAAESGLASLACFCWQVHCELSTIETWQAAQAGSESYQDFSLGPNVMPASKVSGRPLHLAEPFRWSCQAQNVSRGGTWQSAFIGNFIHWPMEIRVHWYCEEFLVSPFGEIECCSFRLPLSWVLLQLWIVSSAMAADCALRDHDYCRPSLPDVGDFGLSDLDFADLLPQIDLDDKVAVRKLMFVMGWHWVRVTTEVKHHIFVIILMHLLCSHSFSKNLGGSTSCWALRPSFLHCLELISRRSLLLRILMMVCERLRLFLHFTCWYFVYNRTSEHNVMGVTLTCIHDHALPRCKTHGQLFSSTSAPDSAHILHIQESWLLVIYFFIHLKYILYMSFLRSISVQGTTLVHRPSLLALSHLHQRVTVAAHQCPPIVVRLRSASMTCQSLIHACSMTWVPCRLWTPSWMCPVFQRPHLLPHKVVPRACWWDLDVLLRLSQHHLLVVSFVICCCFLVEVSPCSLAFMN